MKYYSEITNKVYDTKEELDAAEKELDSCPEVKVEEPAKSEDTKEVASPRKIASDRVQDAFNALSKIKQANKVKDAELQKQLDEIIDQYNKDLDALKRTKDDAIDKLRKESAKYQADEQKAWETALKTLSDFSQKFGKWHGSFDGKSADLIPLLMRVDPKYFFDPFEDLTSFFIRF